MNDRRGRLVPATQDIERRLMEQGTHPDAHLPSENPNYLYADIILLTRCRNFPGQDPTARKEGSLIIRYRVCTTASLLRKVVDLTWKCPVEFSSPYGVSAAEIPARYP